jgi:DNA polymerase Ligase (LigD)
MPRFVVLRHQTPPAYPRPLHWDFMLQRGAELRVWALSEEPLPGHSIRAEALPDHRPFYLDYEGEVSADRGVVSRWDHGTFRWLTDEDESVSVELQGQKLAGRATLARMDRTGRWEFRLSSG